MATNMEQLQALLPQAEAIVREAGALVNSLKHPQVYTKDGHANFVTEADLSSQKFLLEKLTPLLPEAHFFAEEQKENHLAPGFNWVIDPIDGTTNFMRGYRPCAISVGLVKDGAAVLGLVYDVWAQELFTAVKGGGAFCNGQPIRASQAPLENALISFGTSPYYRDRAQATFAAVKDVFLHCGDVRRSGSAALDLCYVAAGRSDGFFESILSPWDFCAASLILQEAGAQISSLEGPLRCDKAAAVLAGSPAVFQALCDFVRPHFAGF